MLSKEELREQAEKKLENILGRLCETETAASVELPICITQILASTELPSYFREGYAKLDKDTKPIVHYCQVCEYFLEGRNEDGEFAQCSNKKAGACLGSCWTPNANFKKVVS